MLTVELNVLFISPCKNQANSEKNDTHGKSIVNVEILIFCGIMGVYNEYF